MERGFFANPDDDAKALIDAFNNKAQSGHRELYEVIS
jgi:hypothetical protein